jgi:rod shape-determining protein MreD
MSGVWQFVRLTVLVLAMLAAHFALRPLLGARVQIDFLVIALLIVSVAVRPGLAALIGMGLGVLVDGASASGLGSTMLALALVGYIVSWLKAAFFAENALLNFVVIFFSAWLVGLVRSVLLGTVALDTSFAMTTLVWLPLSATVTAIIGAVLFALVRPLAGDPVLSRR